MAKLGLALDLGSTNIAGYMVNLDKPKDFASVSVPNSQSKHGADIVTRLTFAANSPGGTADLRSLIVNDINNIIHALSKRLKVNRKRLDRIVVAGNTVILHFLLGRPVEGLLSYPFKSALEGTVSINAEEIGIVASKKTKLILLPAISPFIGSDAVAGILYTKMNRTSSKKLLIDLGTNAEIILGNKDKIIAASAAAGPAFKTKEVTLGSALISGVAGMLDSGAIDKTGRITKAAGGITQQDVRSLQLAKAAVNAAVKILLNKSGWSVSDLSKILIAGLFGEKIDKKDALKIGLIPPVGPNSIRPIGNSSLGGAKMVLMEPSLLEEAVKVAGSVEHVELSGEKAYQDEFIAAMDF